MVDTQAVHQQAWLEKFTAHRRKRREQPPDHSSLVLKGGAEPSFQPPDFSQGTTKVEGLRQANSKSKRREKSLQTSHSQIFFRNFRLSLTFLLFFFFTFLSPHPSPSLSQLVHNERKALNLPPSPDPPSSSKTHSVNIVSKKSVKNISNSKLQFNFQSKRLVAEAIFQASGPLRVLFRPAKCFFGQFLSRRARF